MEKSYSESYAAAGVDITAGYARGGADEAACGPHHDTERCIGGLGGFGGLFELDMHRHAPTRC